MVPVVHYVTLVGISSHAVFVAVFFALGLPTLALFNVYSVASWIGARVLNRTHPQLAAFLLFVEVVSHGVLASLLLGWNSGFHYYLIPVVPFLLFHDRLSTRIVIAGSALVTAIYILLRVATIDVVPGAISPVILRLIEYGNMAIPLTAL